MLRWLDTVFQTLTINYVAMNKDLEILPQLF